MKRALQILLLILIFPCFAKAVTMEEYQNAVASIAESAATTYSGEWVYSYFWGGSPSNPIDKSDEIRDRRNKAMNGQKTSGYIYGSMKSKAGIEGRYTDKFSVYCETFVQVIVRYASNGAVSYSSDYERINVSELQRGDMIHFPNHIAIYLGPGEGNTYRVAHASGRIFVANETRTPDCGYRLKASALAKLDYNYVTSSYDFHDRLDDYAPIIKSVTLAPNSNKITIIAEDYKHYDLTPPSDIIEPENSGIVGYQVTTSDTTPTNFKKVNRTQRLEVVDEVTKSGKYYIWVIDVGGNVTSYPVTLNNIVVDSIKPKIGSLVSKSSKNSIEVIINGASDENGIKEYRYYLDDELVNRSAINSYTFDDLRDYQEYSIYYEVVDNYGNISKSSVYKLKPGIDAKRIVLKDNKITLSLNEIYLIEPIIDAETSNYTIKYTSANSNIASVSSSGSVKGLKPGDTTITVSVGKNSAVLNVHVSKYDVKFLTDVLPTAYVGENYDVLIKTNINTIITLYSGTLPSGIYISNNAIKGKPTSSALGKYNFTLIATIDGETFTKNFTLNVLKTGSDFNYLYVLIPIIIGVSVFGYFKFIKVKKDDEI